MVRLFRKSSTFKMLLLLTAFQAVCIALCATATVTVNTTSGPITGFEQNVEGKTIYTFFGIPYAKPPLGSLRFRFPLPVDPWSTPRNCTVLPNTCYQERDKSDIEDGFPSRGVNMWNPNTKLDEDCLYLNVWTPNVDSGSLTTLVWIYGGAFISGSSTLDVYQGHLIASRQNVIVMSMQHRIRTLGFLYLNSSAAPGNAGLADQLEALKWYVKNIKTFGGDPTKVTLFGESSGASSVNYLILIAYQQQSNLFQSAIMQSACALGQWSYVENTEMMADLASFWNCTMCTPGDIECLYNATAEQLTKCGGGMLPTTDFNGFVPERPSKLMAAGKFRKMPILIGVCQNEGSYFVLYNNKKLINYTRSRDEVKDDDLPNYVNSIWYPEAHTQLPVEQDRIHQEYLTFPTDADNQTIDRNLDAIEQIWGDRDFKCPIRALGHHFALAGQPVYFYVFKHRTANNPWPAWAGVLHADEIEYVFGLPLPGEYKPEEKRLSDVVQTAWANFAKNQNPKIPGVLDWPLFGPSTNDAYVIFDGQSTDKNQFRVGYNFRKAPCEYISQFKEYKEFSVLSASASSCVFSQKSVAAAVALMFTVKNFFL